VRLNNSKTDKENGESYPVGATDKERLKIHPVDD
jgi:hypothetical protein